MIKVALTGNIASGKSQIETFFCHLGVKILDADKIVIDLYQKESFLDEITAKFSHKNLIKNNQLNKGKLIFELFNDKIFKKDFENFIHPIVWEKIEEFFAENKNEKFVIISIPLLFECDWQNRFDKIILATADENIRIERLMARNNVTKEDALKRIAAQLSDVQKIKFVDFIIENNSTFDSLKLNVQKVFEELNELK
ncbi:dephospho-CoA kinase [bacterium]|nr:dephospho-CoA kinase [bacterium]